MQEVLVGLDGGGAEGLVALLPREPLLLFAVLYDAFHGLAWLVEALGAVEFDMQLLLGRRLVVALFDLREGECLTISHGLLLFA